MSLNIKIVTHLYTILLSVLCIFVFFHTVSVSYNVSAALVFLRHILLALLEFFSSLDLLLSRLTAQMLSWGPCLHSHPGNSLHLSYIDFLVSHVCLLFGLNSLILITSIRPKESVLAWVVNTDFICLKMCLSYLCSWLIIYLVIKLIFTLFFTQNFKWIVQLSSGF